MTPDDRVEARDRRDARIAWSLLGVTLVAFVLFQHTALPRLSNAHFGDVEFTGWSGPMATNLVRGLRPYVDFVLPIPPGSLAVLALVQKITGKALLLQELVLNEAMHLVMGLLAYVIARSFASRKSAVWTAITSLLIVWEINKECGYDQTAEAFAWATLAAGARALLGPDEARRRRLFLLAGLLAGLTLAFKQSTGLGAIGGWYVGLGYLAAEALVSKEHERARQLRATLVSYSTGVGLGLLLLWLLLLGLGSTARAFFQAAFVDGSALKGGPLTLAKNLFLYLFAHDAFPASLGALALALPVGFRLAQRRGRLHSRAEPLDARFTTWEAIASGLLVVVWAALAIALLRAGPPGYPLAWVPRIDAFKHAALLGLVAMVVVFVSHLVSTAEGKDPLPAGPRIAGHSLNAIVIAGIASTLMHNTSAPEFRPFYDNNAIIPIAMASLFLLLERAELPRVALLMVLLTFAGAFGNKYFRAMNAVVPAGAGHWAHLRLNVHEVVIAKAATRARELAGPEGSVLVVPEDIQLSALIDRPRPPLRGAIVFVDQYPAHLAGDDVQRLEENLPDVIVVHPRNRLEWERFFRIWSGTSGAERVINHVTELLIPRHYELDSSYPTTFLWQPALLDVYVKKKDAR